MKQCFWAFIKVITDTKAGLQTSVEIWVVFVICYCRGNVSHTITLQSNQKEISTTEFSKPSMKFWAVGVFGLIWSFTGCYNYIIQADPEVLAQFPEAYWVVINSRPGWVSSSFVIAVFGGALGSALMLVHRAVARPVLLLSLLGVVVTMLQALWVIGSAPGGLA